MILNFFPLVRAPSSTDYFPKMTIYFTSVKIVKFVLPIYKKGSKIVF